MGSSSTSYRVPPSHEFRSHWAQVVRTAFEGVTAAPSDASWKVVFSLTQLIFGRAQDGKYPNKALCRRRLALLREGRVTEMDSFVSLSKHAPDGVPRRPSTLTPDDARAQRAAALVNIGEISRGWRTLHSDFTLAPDSEAHFQDLAQLHRAHTLPEAPSAPPATPTGMDSSQARQSPTPPLFAPASPPVSPSSAPIPQSPGAAPGASQPDLLQPPAPPPPPPPITLDSVVDALKKSPSGSAPGPSGWRGEHLMAVFSRPDLWSAHSLDVHLFKLISLFHSGEHGLSAEAREYVFGANLIGLLKPAGGIRPIALGELFGRLAGKAAAIIKRSEFLAFFQPRNQFGVSASAGSEAIIHAITTALTKHPEWVLIQLDFRNAFNTVSRQLIRSQLVLHFPELLPYFDARYGRATRLLVHGRVIWSMIGVQQGDPLGPFFFALALNAVLHNDDIADRGAAFKGVSSVSLQELCLLLAYLDDVNICGPPEEVAELTNRILRATARLSSGLSLNVAKTAVTSLGIEPAVLSSTMSALLDANLLSFHDTISALEQNFDGTELLKDVGSSILGAPLGSSAYGQQQMRKKLLALVDKMNRVNLLPSIQHRLLLLRLCVIPSLNYLYRTVLPSDSLDAATNFDSIIANGLPGIQEVGIPTGAPAQVVKDWSSLISLPKGWGGTGLTSAVDTHGLMFVSSIATAWPTMMTPCFKAIHADLISLSISKDSEVNQVLQSFHLEIEARRARDPSFAESYIADIPRSFADLTKVKKKKLQKFLTSTRHEMAFGSLWDRSSQTIRAQLLSKTQRGSSSFLDAIPSSKALTISNQVMKFACYSSQLVREFCNLSESCTCAARNQGPSSFAERDVAIAHVESCGLNYATTLRHDCVVQALVRMLNTPGLALHAHDLSGARGSKEHHQPDIHSLLADNSFVEVSITCPAQARLCAVASRTPLHASNVREQEKNRKYGKYAASLDRQLFSAVLESKGAFGKGLQSVMSRCSSQVDRVLFAEGSDDRTWASRSFLAFWSQSVSVAFWRGSYQMFLSRQTALGRDPLSFYVRRWPDSGDSEASGSEDEAAPDHHPVLPPYVPRSGDSTPHSSPELSRHSASPGSLGHASPLGLRPASPEPPLIAVVVAVDLYPAPPVALQLPPGGDDIVQTIWDTLGLLEVPMVTAFSVEITGRSLQTLNNLNWLNDEIINLYHCMISHRSAVTPTLPRTFAQSTFLYELLCRPDYTYASVARHTKKLVTEGGIFGLDLMLVPVHLGGHWCEGAVNFPGKKILYYDSLRGENPRFFTVIMRYLVAEADARGVQFSPIGWSLEYPSNAPRQTNGSDCGVFACMCGESLSRGHNAFSYNQGDMPLLRRRFVYEIVTNQEILPPYLGVGLTAGPMFPPRNAPVLAGAPLAAPGGGVTISPADLVRLAADLAATLSLQAQGGGPPLIAPTSPILVGTLVKAISVPPPPPAPSPGSLPVQSGLLLGEASGACSSHPSPPPPSPPVCPDLSGQPQSGGGLGPPPPLPSPHLSSAG